MSKATRTSGIEMKCFYCTETLHYKFTDEVLLYNDEPTCKDCYDLLVSLAKESEEAKQ